MHILKKSFINKHYHILLYIYICISQGEPVFCKQAKIVINGVTGTNIIYGLWSGY